MKEIKINKNTYLLNDDILIKKTIEADKLPVKPEPFTLVYLKKENGFYYFNGSYYNQVQVELKNDKETSGKVVEDKSDVQAESKEETKVKKKKFYVEG